MKLKYVTLTGADDNTDPKALVEISQRFPYVEWGILFHPDKRGTPRYPTAAWVDELPYGLNYSAHLCGAYVDHWFKNTPENKRMFSRIQLNCTPDKLAEILKSKWNPPARHILGTKYKTAWIPTVLSAGFNVLVDFSGGRGISPEKWPEYPENKTNQLIGYAGGIGPDNIHKELERIAVAAGDHTVWIDMESKLRTDDRFDLDKCIQILEAAKTYVST
jgi:hypothetical protein